MSSHVTAPPTILVTDAERSCAVSIIRSLGQRGWRVIAASSNPHSPGLRSRFTNRKLLYPSPTTAPDQFVDSVDDAVRLHGIDLIFPVTDNTILPLVDARERFEGICRLAIPPTDALEITRDKLKTIELAKQVGVPTPQTIQVRTVDEALEFGPELGWPLVLKPQVSHLYHDHKSVLRFSVGYANDRDCLAEQMRHFEGHCPVLLQEYFAGTGYGVEVLMREGELLAAFQHQRLREVPISGGASALRQSVPLHPDLYRYTKRLMSELNWTGLAMAEFKLGREGARLMEINGRVWGSLPLAVFSGVDFPAQLVELCLFDSLPSAKHSGPCYKTGVRAHSLQKELSWIAEVLLSKRRYPFLAFPSRYQGLSAVAELFNPTYRFDVLSWRDPGPGLALLFNVIAALGNSVKPRVGRERVARKNGA